MVVILPGRPEAFTLMQRDYEEEADPSRLLAVSDVPEEAAASGSGTEDEEVLPSEDSQWSETEEESGSEIWITSGDSQSSCGGSQECSCCW